MQNPSPAQQRLVQHLAQLQFAERFYALYQELAASAPGQAGDLAIGECILEQFPGAQYVKKEQFYRYSQAAGPFDLLLHVQARHGQAELGLYIKQGETLVAGGTFHSLAQAAMRAHTPDYKHNPPYPRLPFGDDPSLTRILQFGRSALDDVARMVAADPAVLTAE